MFPFLPFPCLLLDTIFLPLLYFLSCLDIFWHYVTDFTNLENAAFSLTVKAQCAVLLPQLPDRPQDWTFSSCPSYCAPVTLHLSLVSVHAQSLLLRACAEMYVVIHTSSNCAGPFLQPEKPLPCTKSYKNLIHISYQWSLDWVTWIRSRASSARNHKGKGCSCIMGSLVGWAKCWKQVGAARGGWLVGLQWRFRVNQGSISQCEFPHFGGLFRWCPMHSLSWPFASCCSPRVLS